MLHEIGVRCCAAEVMAKGAYRAKRGALFTVFRVFRAFFTLFPSISKMRIWANFSDFWALSCHFWRFRALFSRFLSCLTNCLSKWIFALRKKFFREGKKTYVERINYFSHLHIARSASCEGQPSPRDGWKLTPVTPNAPQRKGLYFSLSRFHGAQPCKGKKKDNDNFSFFNAVYFSVLYGKGDFFQK